MNKSVLEHKLKDMIGKTYAYGGQVHYVKNASVNHTRELAIIETNVSRYERRFDSAPEFLKQWQPLTAAPSAVVGTAVPSTEIVTTTNVMAEDVIQLLKDAAVKVKDDPSYIPQAQAMVNCSNGIMNVVRTKLDVLKHANGEKK